MRWEKRPASEEQGSASRLGHEQWRLLLAPRSHSKTDLRRRCVNAGVGKR